MDLGEVHCARRRKLPFAEAPCPFRGLCDAGGVVACGDQPLRQRCRSAAEPTVRDRCCHHRRYAAASARCCRDQRCRCLSDGGVPDALPALLVLPGGTWTRRAATARTGRSPFVLPDQRPQIVWKFATRAGSAPPDPVSRRHDRLWLTRLRHLRTVARRTAALEARYPRHGVCRAARCA